MRAVNQPRAGYFPGGLPYNRVGQGPRPLVIFPGLLAALRPQSGMVLMLYLETESERNVTFCFRHGFEVLTEGKAPGHDVML
jgi:hypothetical protein